MKRLEYTPYDLEFEFPAQTSRGTLHKKRSYFIRITDAGMPGRMGLGEVSLIPGLSPESEEEVEKILAAYKEVFPDPKEIANISQPAIRFAIEMALLSIGSRNFDELYDGTFTQGGDGIRTNGLVWMAPISQMKEQVDDLVEKGFTCIKCKIGGLPIVQELELLSYIRQQLPEAEIRVDANGAFTPATALDSIKRYAEYGLHSIEQPIAPGNIEEMTRICKQSLVPVALDEELIGVKSKDEKKKLLEALEPAYIVLKPSLIGGLTQAQEWITIAETYGVKWWITSALESNIGLNAIAQFAAKQFPELDQGLGTGGLFNNNIPSPLRMDGPRLWKRFDQFWDLSPIHFKE